MTIKRSALAIVLVAGIGVVFALSAATGAAGESKTAKLAKGGFVMHDFGVTLFPTFMNDAQPTCALQSPRWIYKGEDLQQEEFEELWDNMTSVAGQTPTGWTVTNSDPFLTFHPADAAGWPSAGLEVDVSISFDGGHPFYWYPAGDAGTNESIEWKDLKLSKALPGNLKLQKARKIAVEKKYVDHWYEEARKGGSLYTISGKTADQVLFYGGFMKMKPAVSITKKDSNFYITSLLGTTLKNVVFIEKRGKEIHYARIDSLAPGDDGQEIRRRGRLALGAVAREGRPQEERGQHRRPDDEDGSPRSRRHPRYLPRQGEGSRGDGEGYGYSRADKDGPHVALRRDSQVAAGSLSDCPTIDTEGCPGRPGHSFFTFYSKISNVFPPYSLCPQWSRRLRLIPLGLNVFSAETPIFRGRGSPKTDCFIGQNVTYE